MARWMSPLLVLAALALCAGCKDSKTKMQERQRARDAERKAQEDEAEAKRKAAQPKIEEAKLERFWADPIYVRAQTGKPCPDGLWALFPGAPGETPAEQAANEARRAELVTKVRSQTYVAVMPFDFGTTLRKYNPKRKQLTVEVDGVLECFDKLGLLTLAWGEPATAFRPPPKADDDEEELSPQAVWRARPLLFPLPFATAAEAKRFREAEGLNLSARVVFTLGKVDVDTKMQKTAQPMLLDGAVPEATLDWGAGRLVHVDVVGVRIATDHEKKQLAERRNR